MKQRVDQFVRHEGLQRLIDRTLIKVTRHPSYPNLMMLKYASYESPMEDPLTRQCRGIILDEADDWNIVSWPYEKFFNYGEQYAADVSWDTARVFEKLDGSLMTLYPYRGQWHVASSGHPSAAGDVFGAEGFTFAKLFWQTWRELGYRLPEISPHCYMFELMTPLNRIVIPHKKSRLVFHGVRQLLEKFSFAEMAPDGVASYMGWECAKTYPLSDLQGVLSMANSLNGLEQEGFVICDSRFNRLKIKAKQYVALHHLRDSLSIRRMVEIVQANEGAEFLTYFPEMTFLYHDIHSKFWGMAARATSYYLTVKDIEVQKDFAQAIKDYEFKHALFATRSGKVADPETWFMNYDSRKIVQMLGLKDEKEDQDAT